MTLKCLRGLSQALVHGCFINHHVPQLMGLIIFDILLVVATYSMYKLFSYRVSFILFFSYLLTFLCFDLVLFAYTMEVGSEASLDDDRESVYNFVFVIIIITFLVITGLRLMVSIGIPIFLLIKKSCIRNKI